MSLPQLVMVENYTQLLTHQHNLCLINVILQFSQRITWSWILNTIFTQQSVLLILRPWLHVQNIFFPGQIKFFQHSMKECCVIHETRSETRMWANAQRDGRPVGGALCSTLQTLADVHYLSAVQ